MRIKSCVDERLCQVKQAYSLHACRECVCLRACAAMYVWWGHQLIREMNGVWPGTDNPIRRLKRCDRLRSRKYDLIKGTLWPCAACPVPKGWQVWLHTNTDIDTFNKTCLPKHWYKRMTTVYTNADKTDPSNHSKHWSEICDLNVLTNKRNKNTKKKMQGEGLQKCSFVLSLNKSGYKGDTLRTG